MRDAISFALPSLMARGQALVHDSGAITLQFTSGPCLGVTSSLQGMSAGEARAIAAALVAAADLAEQAKARKVTNG